MNRRHWLQLLIAGLSSFLASSAQAKRERFAHQGYETTLDQLLPKETSLVETNQLELQLPEIAENGAVVPITISSKLSGIELFHILVEKNPTPLAASFRMSPNLMPLINTRIKMAESCHVVIVAKQGERWLIQKRWVTVLIGGCGAG